MPPRESQKWPQIQEVWIRRALHDNDESVAREIGNDFGYPTREILSAVEGLLPYIDPNTDDETTCMSGSCYDNIVRIQNQMCCFTWNKNRYPLIFGNRTR